MAAAPAAAAVWADVLWCLGLGCLLWAVRDGAELLVGRGPVRCFVLDLLAFTAAAVLLSPPTAEKSGKIKKIWKKPVAKEVEDII